MIILSLTHVRMCTTHIHTHTCIHTQHNTGHHHRSTGHRHHHHHGGTSSSSHHHSSGSSHHHSSRGHRPSSAGGSSNSSGGGSSSRSKGTSSRPPGDEIYVGKYKLVKTIGKGNFAKVKLAKHMPTGQEVCSCMYGGKEEEEERLRKLNMSRGRFM